MMNPSACSKATPLTPGPAHMLKWPIFGSVILIVDGRFPPMISRRTISPLAHEGIATARSVNRQRVALQKRFIVPLYHNTLAEGVNVGMPVTEIENHSLSHKGVLLC